VGRRAPNKKTGQETGDRSSAICRKAVRESPWDMEVRPVSRLGQVARRKPWADLQRSSSPPLFGRPLPAAGGGGSGRWAPGHVSREIVKYPDSPPQLPAAAALALREYALAALAQLLATSQLPRPRTSPLPATATRARARAR
jgi:hypothetical protein